MGVSMSKDFGRCPAGVLERPRVECDLKVARGELIRISRC